MEIATAIKRTCDNFNYFLWQCHFSEKFISATSFLRHSVNFLQLSADTDSARLIICSQLKANTLFIFGAREQLFTCRIKCDLVESEIYWLNGNRFFFLLPRFPSTSSVNLDKFILMRIPEGEKKKIKVMNERAACLQKSCLPFIATIICLLLKT